jgi:hypothetical protein
VNERGPPLARSELGWSGADAGGGGGGSPGRCCLPRWEGRVIALRALSGSSDRSWVPDLSSYRCPKRASERFDLWSKCDGTPSLAGVLGLIDLEVGVGAPFVAMAHGQRVAINRGEIIRGQAGALRRAAPRGGQ